MAAQMMVMNNLYRVLERLRCQDVNRILWIDGICINQEDVEERSQQVLLMKQVYQQAKAVLCWIGEEEDDTEAAFRTISKLAAACKIRARGDRGSFDLTTVKVTIDEVIVEET
jgi:hypothetical protein